MTQKQLLIGFAILIALTLGYYFLIYKPKKDNELVVYRYDAYLKDILPPLGEVERIQFTTGQRN